jgi:hypothetical protein
VTSSGGHPVIAALQYSLTRRGYWIIRFRG